MGIRARFAGNAMWFQVVLLAALIGVSRFLLFEEEERAGLVGGHDPERKRALPPELLSHERDYLDGVDESIAAYSRVGMVRRRRFHALTFTALACASAVPVVVAASAPGWAVAILGAAAAVAQGTEQLLQDQRLSAESHNMAVLLSQEIRRFRYKAEPTSDSAQREVFDEFVNRVEEIRDKQGSILMDLMRQAPSLEKAP